MRRPPAVKPLGAGCRPLDAACRWPAARPLLMLHSAGGHPRWGRWSVLARPRAWLTCRNGTSVRGRLPDDHHHISLTGEPLADLDAVLAVTRVADAPPVRTGMPFLGGWIGFLSYELGRVIEPAAQHRQATASDPEAAAWPLIELAWCPDALVHDGVGDQWYGIGEADEGWLADSGGSTSPDSPEPPFTVGPLSSSLEPDAYLDAVARTIGYIAAGDIFQANITHRLRADFTGSTRALARGALAESGAWYGAYLELPDGRCLASMSPELFLDVNAARRSVVTRPIKGTRPSHVDRRELEESAKDAAELHMIVDLMRNDLGRVCEYGTVRTPVSRVIESHRTVHHGVGEVTGTLRADVSVGGLLAAAFPGGSVTGAPKIRAMQIIEELEPVRRGPYCGAIGFFSDGGDVRLNIAIRTIALAGEREEGRFDRLDGALHYGVGGGIVADSQPVAEYRESLDKAAVLRLALGAPSLVAAAPRARVNH